jgi:hypothetical protein
MILSQTVDVWPKRVKAIPEINIHSHIEVECRYINLLLCNHAPNIGLELEHCMKFVLA